MAAESGASSFEAIQMKTCDLCSESKPATTQYFSPARESRDGLKHQCKPCHAEKMRQRRAARSPAEKQAIAEARKAVRRQKPQWTPANEEKYPLRRCLKCKEIKPNNPDHFHRQYTADGLNPWCRLCMAANHQANADVRNKNNRDNYLLRKNADPRKVAQVRKDWREANRERCNLLLVNWRERNPERLRQLRVASEARRRTRKTEAGGSFTADDIRRLIAAQRNRCWWCSEKLTDYHVDHRIPVSKGGHSNPSNLVISCPSCNLKRNAAMPWEGPIPRLL